MSKYVRSLSFCILLVLGVLSLCCSVAPSVHGPYGYHRGSIESLRNATVALVKLKNTSDASVPDDGEPMARSYCSGVWISETRILTAGHCVEGLKIGALVDVASYSESDWGPGHEARINETHSARLIKFGGTGVDLALLAAFTPNPHGWEPIASGAEDGEPVTIVGHPIGLLWNVVPGMVSAHRWVAGPTNNDHAAPYLHITSGAFFGNSGGAAFNERGEIVGICSFLIRGPLMSFFVPSEDIRKFVS